MKAMGTVPEDIEHVHERDEAMDKIQREIEAYSCGVDLKILNNKKI